MTGCLADQQPEAERWTARFRRFIQRTKVTIGVPGLSVDIDMQKELKSSEPFVKELRTKLAFQLGELHQEVASFFTDRVGQHKDQHPGSQGVVMIVDSLEKLRGTTEKETCDRLTASS